MLKCLTRQVIDVVVEEWLPKQERFNTWMRVKSMSLVHSDKKAKDGPNRVIGKGTWNDWSWARSEEEKANEWIWNSIHPYLEIDVDST